MRIIFDRFPEGKTKALTMSYDDGRDHDLRLIEIFNKYGIKGTFHLNSAPIEHGSTNHVGIEDVREKYKGHEISLHTHTHPHLERAPREEIVFETMENRRLLEKWCGYPVTGMSYPYGTCNADVREVLRALGVVYSRTAQATKSFEIPSDFLLWHPTCHYMDPKLMDYLEQMMTLPRWRSPLPVFYVWGHSYEFADYNNWELIENFCATVSGKDEVWCATNMEIYVYVNALRSLVVSADRTVIKNPTAIDVWVSADGASVKIPAGATVTL